jgi:hypothetical protein
MRAILAAIVAVVVLALSVPLVAAFAEAPLGNAPPPYLVIVHPSNPTTSVERKFLAEAFLKKTTRWPHGDVIRPVDLGPDSAVRQRFVRDVMDRSVAAVRSYWQQIIFSGRDVPPPELDSDADVVKFVAKYAGAVGYVSGVANVAGTKVVAVR